MGSHYVGKRFLDESAMLRTWREIDDEGKRWILSAIRCDIYALEDDGSGECIKHARILRIAHDALVAAGALGPTETIDAIERNR